MGNLDNAVKANLAKLGVPSVAYVKAAGYTGTAGRNYRLIVLYDMGIPENGAGQNGVPASSLADQFRRLPTTWSTVIPVVQVSTLPMSPGRPGANSDGIQIEQAGFVSQDRNGGPTRIQPQAKPDGQTGRLAVCCPWHTPSVFLTPR